MNVPYAILHPDYMNYEIRRKIGESELIAGVSPVLSVILHNRSILATDLKTFREPNYDTRYDPMLFLGMKKVVDRIILALEQDEHIAIYSDYDCDGIPGAVVWSDFFKKIKYSKVTFYIPHRHKEGYGMNIPSIDTLAAQGVRLIITVDLGITNVAEVAYTKSKGIDVIVTDHHLPHVEMQNGIEVQILPLAFEVINAKRTGETYPEKMLCGCATAWKVVCAIIATVKGSQENNFGSEAVKNICVLPEGFEKWSLDMVGLSTIADMVPLTGENRLLAYYGLKVLRKSKRMGLKALLKTASANQDGLTEDDVGFTIGPRLNAASRMDTPELAFKLLSTDSYDEAQTTAKKLQVLNTNRKESVSGIMKLVHKELQARELSDVIVIGNISWTPGVLGLIAGKVLDMYARPVFVWGSGEDEMTLKGSCRSDGSVNVVDLMCAVTDGIFTHMGGHEMAGGFSMLRTSVHDISPQLQIAYAKIKKENYISAKNIFVDCELPLAYVTYRLMDEIDTLAPFGVANQKPAFLFTDVEIVEIRHFGKELNHLEMRVKKGETIVKIFGYFMGAHSFIKSVGTLEIGKIITVVGHLEREMYKNRRNIQVRIVDVI